MPQLIVFAGLPGSGKTTLAKLLAPRLNAVLLNKDEVRAALFAPEDVEYSDRQNDFCMEVIYQLAKYHLTQRPERPVIIDGRTFSKKKQVETLLQTLKEFEICIIYCRCCEEIATARIAKDSLAHIAKDRTVEQFQKLVMQNESLQVPHILIDTGSLITESLVDFIAASVVK